jgi:hypothetical protein
MNNEFERYGRKLWWSDLKYSSGLGGLRRTMKNCSHG